MSGVRILKCPKCASYALEAQCPCGGTRVQVNPPKYSPDDKYASYRRKYKEMQKGNA